MSTIEDVLDWELKLTDTQGFEVDFEATTGIWWENLDIFAWTWELLLVAEHLDGYWDLVVVDDVERGLSRRI